MRGGIILILYLFCSSLVEVSFWVGVAVLVVVLGTKSIVRDIFLSFLFISFDIFSLANDLTNATFGLSGFDS